MLRIGQAAQKQLEHYIINVKPSRYVQFPATCLPIHQSILEPNDQDTNAEYTPISKINIVKTKLFAS